MPAPDRHFKNILITGASSGLGAALALHYAAPGKTLALSGRDHMRLSAIADQCHAKGALVLKGICDVTDRAAMSRWILAVDAQAPLDLVIANAGISGGAGGVIEGEPAEQARAIFDVNLTGVLNTFEPIIPRLKSRRVGQLAVMSSLASFNGWPGAPAYSASKAAVRVYGEALRGSLAAYNIGVTVLCPGFVRTAMTAVNDYPMPFLMDADRAAAIMARGMACNRARVAFPWPMALFSGLGGLLPPGLSAWLLARAPAKPARRG